MQAAFLLRRSWVRDNVPPMLLTRTDDVIEWLILLRRTLVAIDERAATGTTVAIGRSQRRRPCGQ
jgi:hypothetical protein